MCCNTWQSDRTAVPSSSVSSHVAEVEESEVPRKMSTCEGSKVLVRKARCLLPSERGMYLFKNPLCSKPVNGTKPITSAIHSFHELNHLLWLISPHAYLYTSQPCHSLICSICPIHLPQFILLLDLPFTPLSADPACPSVFSIVEVPQPSSLPLCSEQTLGGHSWLFSFY